MRTRWIGFAVLTVVLTPLGAIGAASTLTALAALAALAVMLLAHARAFGNWLILLAIGLLLAPALYISLILVERMMGVPAHLTVWSIVSQRTDILAQAVACTAVFTAAAVLAWLWWAGSIADLPLPARLPQRRMGLITLVLVVTIWLFCLVNFDLQQGQTILTMGYNLSQGHALFYSGMWAVVANISLLFLELSAVGAPAPVRFALTGMWGLQILVFVLHGNRVDMIAAGLILLVVRGGSFRRQLILMAICGLLAVPLLTFFSVFRELAATNTVSVSAMIARSESILAHMQNVGDLGDFAVTTSAGIYMVESGRRPLSYGASYVNDALRLAPTALRSHAAIDAGRIFVTYGLDTNGGMTPVSEAYFNFGLWGEIVLGLAHGSFIAWLYRRRYLTPTPFWICLFTFAVAYTLRVYFYDSFDLLKGGLVLAAYYGLITIIDRLQHSESSGAAVALPSR